MVIDCVQLIIGSDMRSSLLFPFHVWTQVFKQRSQFNCGALASVPSAGRKHDCPFLMGKHRMQICLKLCIHCWGDHKLMVWNIIKFGVLVKIVIHTRFHMELNFTLLVKWTRLDLCLKPWSQTCAWLSSGGQLQTLRHKKIPHRNQSLWNYRHNSFMLLLHIIHYFRNILNHKIFLST